MQKLKRLLIIFSSFILHYRYPHQFVVKQTMYSFEGEFRRKPQQNLAGASAHQNISRDALLKKTHQERIKRQASFLNT